MVVFCSSVAAVVLKLNSGWLGYSSQALACQPLRRHMSSFVKHYRPMNMAERQRRHDIKDLEAQVRRSEVPGSARSLSLWGIYGT